MTTTNPAPSPQEPSQTSTQTIDALLRRYLTLLDEYTTLRTSLNSLQSSVFQSLARANFVSAQQHGRPYGQDYYDERMQALRRVVVSERRLKCEGDRGENGGGEGNGQEVVFTVGMYPSGDEIEGGAEAEEDKKESGDEGCFPLDDSVKEEDTRSSKEKDQEKKEPSRPKDPLRWFGILTPFPLRQAQAQSIKAVEELIPRLATVSAEMAAVELGVRRARKKRAKAEKVEEKRILELGQRTGGVGAAA